MKYKCLNCDNWIEIEDEINTDEVTCSECNSEFDVTLEEEADTGEYWFYLERKQNDETLQ